LNIGQLPCALCMKSFPRVPLTIYRIQANLPVRLRDYDSQMALGRTSFDLKLHNGLVLPMPLESEFHTPNGMSLRPAGENMRQILENFRGSPRIYRFQEYMALPEGLILFHEHTDHYSLQTSVPTPLDELNQKLTMLLESLPSVTKEQWLDWYNDPDDQDN